jgi:hypothetical protein
MVEIPDQNSGLKFTLHSELSYPKYELIKIIRHHQSERS